LGQWIAVQEISDVSTSVINTFTSNVRLVLDENDRAGEELRKNPTISAEAPLPVPFFRPVLVIVPLFEVFSATLIRSYGMSRS
jgi:hypothetical protein